MQDLFKKKNVCQYKQQLVIGFIAPKDKCYSGDLKQVIVIHNSSDYVHSVTAGGISVSFMPAFLLHMTAALTAAVLTSAGLFVIAHTLIVVMYGGVEARGRAALLSVGGELFDPFIGFIFTHKNACKAVKYLLIGMLLLCAAVIGIIGFRAFAIANFFRLLKIRCILRCFGIFIAVRCFVIIRRFRLSFG